MNSTDQAKSDDNYTIFDILKKCILETIQHVTFERFNHWLLRWGAFFSVNCSKKEKESERRGKKRKKDWMIALGLRKKETAGSDAASQVHWLRSAANRMSESTTCPISLRFSSDSAYRRAWWALCCGYLFPDTKQSCLLHSCFRT